MGTAENNLFNPAYTSGDLTKIGPIVRIGQTLSVWIISIIGFGITISTVVKQAMHGLYATNPQLWDRVDEVHRTKIAQLAGEVKSGGNEVSALLGFVQSFIFSFLPNVKAVTEFDGDTTDPKTFFTKSLPVACLYLFIGVFIFYGYTTKFGEKVSQFGTTLLDNFFLRVDPIEWASKIPDKIAKIDLATDGSQLPFDKEVNTVTRQCLSATFSTLTDITKEKQIECAKVVENWVMECMNKEPRPYADPDLYALNVTASTTVGAPDLQYIHGSKANDGTITFAYSTPLTTFNTGSVMEQVNTHHIRLVLTFKPVAQKTVKVKSVKCSMTGGSVKKTSKGYEIDLGSASAGSIYSVSGVGKIGGVDCNITVSGTKLVLTPKGSKDLPDGETQVTDIQSVYYTINSAQHPITLMTFNGDTGASITFSPVDNTSINSWQFGEEPAAKKSGNEGTGVDSGEDNGEDEPTTKSSGDEFNNQ